MSFDVVMSVLLITHYSLLINQSPYSLLPRLAVSLLKLDLKDYVPQTIRIDCRVFVRNCDRPAISFLE